MFEIQKRHVPYLFQLPLISNMVNLYKNCESYFNLLQSFVSVIGHKTVKSLFRCATPRFLFTCFHVSCVADGNSHFNLLEHSLNLQKDLCNNFLQTMHMVYKVKLFISSNYKSWRTIQIHNNRNYNIALTRILWFWERFLHFSTRRTHAVAFIMRMVLYILQTLAKSFIYRHIFM